MTTDKPTDAMIEAGAAVAHERGCYAVTRPDLTVIYTAMHEARPQSAAASPDLVELERRLTEGVFYGDHDEDLRLLGVFRRAIEALTATEPPSDSDAHCPECLGDGELSSGFYYRADHSVGEDVRECPSCDGTGKNSDSDAKGGGA
jgi:hypothetical protein